PPGRARRPQRHPERWLRRRDDFPRSAGREVPRLWLGRPRRRRWPRPRFYRGGAGVGARRARAAGVRDLQYREGQGGLVHGEQPRIPRSRAERGAVRARDAGARMTTIPAPAATREALGPALIRLQEEGADLVVVDADLGKSTSAIAFRDQFP